MYELNDIYEINNQTNTPKYNNNNNNNNTDAELKEFNDWIDILNKNKEFEEWFDNNIGLDHCYILFLQHGVNKVNIFKQLTADHLLQIGIVGVGDRLEILGKISELKKLKFSWHSFQMIVLGFVIGCVFMALVNVVK
eukprot:52105_1